MIIGKSLEKTIETFTLNAILFEWGKQRFFSLNGLAFYPVTFISDVSDLRGMYLLQQLS